MSDIIQVDVTLTTTSPIVAVSVTIGTPGEATDVGAAIHAATAVTAPADADEAALILSPSWLLRKITWANIKAWVKSFLGTAALKDIPATGDASATQVVYGSDTRLAKVSAASYGGNGAADVGKLVKFGTGGDLTVSDFITIGSDDGNAQFLHSIVTVNTTFTGIRTYSLPNGSGFLALTTNESGAATVTTANITDAGATGRTLAQAATVAAADAAIESYSSAISSPATSSSASFASTGASIALGAGTWMVKVQAFYTNASSSSTLFRLSAANWSETNGNKIGFGSVNVAVGNPTFATGGTADLIATSTLAQGTVCVWVVVKLTSAATLTLQFANTTALGTSTVTLGTHMTAKKI